MHLTTAGDWWTIAWIAILTFLLNPLHYVVTGLVIWDLTRNVKLERDWFGVRVTRIGKTLLVRYAKSCLVGLLASVALLAIGVEVSWQSMLYVTLMALVLGLIRSRFAATPFAISASLILSELTKVLPLPKTGAWHGVVQVIQSVQAGPWLAIGAVCSLAELVMTMWNAHDAVLPTLVTSRRGRRIGALKLQLGFVVPVVTWMTPIHHHAVVIDWSVHPWLFANWPPISFGALPLVFGIHALLTSLDPARVLRQLSYLQLIVVLVFIAGFTAGHWLWPAYQWYTAVVVIVLFEVFRFLWRRTDAGMEPMCAPDTRGLRVLYTIRNSLSAKLGVRPGEIVTHVNQIPVHTEYDLHFAMEQNPAYAKFQVIDTRGELRLVSSPVFEGERHQLGLLLVVPSDEPAMRLRRPFGLLETLYLRRAKRHDSE
ncbi:hypothetical protein [Alicyclobacillus acidiphilus]|uniref:hypothetical protein n=1 Tax=Alicyclobacillus acidiphilus TaxID=182455 RepID=UPI0008337EB3|nr:hypothetical protein [Alicyclobacillus acidiphilus]